MPELIAEESDRLIMQPIPSEKFIIWNRVLCCFVAQHWGMLENPFIQKCLTNYLRQSRKKTEIFSNFLLTIFIFFCHLSTTESCVGVVDNQATIFCSKEICLTWTNWNRNKIFTAIIFKDCLIYPTTNEYEEYLNKNTFTEYDFNPVKYYTNKKGASDVKTKM